MKKIITILLMLSSILNIVAGSQKPIMPAKVWNKIKAIAASKKTHIGCSIVLGTCAGIGVGYWWGIRHNIQPADDKDAPKKSAKESIGSAKALKASQKQCASNGLESKKKEIEAQHAHDKDSPETSAQEVAESEILSKMLEQFDSIFSSIETLNIAQKQCAPDEFESKKKEIEKQIEVKIKNLFGNETDNVDCGLSRGNIYVCWTDSKHYSKQELHNFHMALMEYEQIYKKSNIIHTYYKDGLLYDIGVEVKREDTSKSTP